MPDSHAETAQGRAKRTLLMVSPYFPPVLGGLEQYVFRLSGQLQKRHDWRVVVVTSGDPHSPDRCEVINELTVYRLGYGMMLSNTPFDLHWIRRMRQIVQQVNPDIVDAHLPVPGLADVAPLAIGDIPLVVTYHSASMRKGRLRYDLPIWAYERILGHALLSNARRIICTSTASQDFLRRYRKKSIVIPPGVDTGIFHPGSSGSGHRLLFVSNLSRAHTHKGLSYLLQALGDPACHDVSLDVVGDGDGREDYEAQCMRLGIADRVTFYGALYGEELAERYRAAFSLVQPSTNDSLPTTIIEAMACGTPVIASRIGSTATVVQPGATGYLVEPGNVGSLIKGISDLFSDPARAAAYGKAGLELVQSSYTTRQQAERTDALFEQILSSSA
jgi:glycosyltransferase involved in cell wall biosynthesis